MIVCSVVVVLQYIIVDSLESIRVCGIRGSKSANYLGVKYESSSRLPPLYVLVGCEG
jgi:hypothetical protein